MITGMIRCLRRATALLDHGHRPIATNAHRASKIALPPAVHGSWSRRWITAAAIMMMPSPIAATGVMMGAIPVAYGSTRPMTPKTADTRSRSFSALCGERGGEMGG